MHAIFGRHAAGRGASWWSQLAFLFVLIACYFAYRPGLNGPWLLTGYNAVQQNNLIQIQELTVNSIKQATLSSANLFPENQPLTQLTFGLNYLWSGFNPAGFKLINLVFHLLSGVIVFLLAHRLAVLFVLGYRRVLSDTAINIWALFSASVWVLNPVHLSAVLLPEQRSILLSGLLLLFALLLYVNGRYRLRTDQTFGRSLMLSSILFASLSFLTNENPLLFPILVLILEFTLLSGATINHTEQKVKSWFIPFLGILPIIIGSFYFLWHLSDFTQSYDSRAFSLFEHLLSQSRSLWLYLALIYLPDITQYAIFHDDFLISQSFILPISTLFSLLSWSVLFILSLTLRRWIPLLAFTILFYLFSHWFQLGNFAPLIVREESNYIASFSIIFAFGFVLASLSAGRKHSALWIILASGFILAQGLTTHLRATDWNSWSSWIMSEVRHHPDSAIANVRAGQWLFEQAKQSDDAQTLEQARFYIMRARTLDADNLDARLLDIFLDLYQGQKPNTASIRDLSILLRQGIVNSTKFQIQQLDKLMSWHLQHTNRLSHSQVLALYGAALENPKLNLKKRALVAQQLKIYYNQLRNEPSHAILYAQKAVNLWPDNWNLRLNLIELLINNQQFSTAQEQVKQAFEHDPHNFHLSERRRLAQLLEKQKIQ